MTTSQRQLFAIIPAAGHSRRMGKPKLLLPLAGKTVMHCLLDVLTTVENCQPVVVIRSDDDALKCEVEKTSALLIQPDVAPTDMRQSVTVAIDWIREQFSPANDDCWMLIPADHPVLESSLIEKLVHQWEEQNALVMIPTYQGKRGHPTFFRWKLSQEINNIPADKGLNYLVAKYEQQVIEVPVNHPAIVTDLDTPEDYIALLDKYKPKG